MFNEVIFENQGKVFFDVEDLSKVSFLNSDVTEIRFSDKVRWGGDDGFTIIDEKLLKESIENNVAESILATYRSIRQNYERRFRFEDANKLLEREIELQKKYLEQETDVSELSQEVMEAKLNDITKKYNDLLGRLVNLENNIKSDDSKESQT